MRQAPQACPRCHLHTLKVDPKTGRIWCPECGYEAYLTMHGAGSTRAQ